MVIWQWTNSQHTQCVATFAHNKLTVKKIKSTTSAYKYEITPVSENSSDYLKDANAFLAKDMNDAKKKALKIFEQKITNVKHELDDDLETLYCNEH